MTRMQKLLDSLPEKDLKQAKEWMSKHPEEVPKNEDEAVDMLIHNILWEYKYRAERASMSQQSDEARKLEIEKSNLYDKWKELGIL